MSQSQRSVPAPFLTKTYQLVDDRSTDEVISWNEDGTTFVVWKTAEFAKDLLPNYFKHNNFSSFVRQLNTYGFRKIVPDKWEFANDNFKRGQKELLSEIRRRKTVAPPPAPDGGDGGKSAGSPSISGDDLGSSTTSSPDSKNLGSLDSATISQFANLTDENEKLRKEKELLSSELAQKKKQCDELVAFLAQYLKVGLDQVDRIVREGRSGSIPNTVVVSGGGGDGGDGDQKGGEGLKLFGVWLEAGKEKKKKKNKKKRASREEKVGLIGPCPEDMKTLEFQHCPPLKSSKVCN